MLARFEERQRSLLATRDRHDPVSEWRVIQVRVCKSRTFCRTLPQTPVHSKVHIHFIWLTSRCCTLLCMLLDFSGFGDFFELSRAVWPPCSCLCCCTLSRFHPVLTFCGKLSNKISTLRIGKFALKPVHPAINQSPFL